MGAATGLAVVASAEVALVVPCNLVDEAWSLLVRACPVRTIGSAAFVCWVAAGAAAAGFGRGLGLCVIGLLPALSFSWVQRPTIRATCGPENLSSPAMRRTVASSTVPTASPVSFSAISKRFHWAAGSGWPEVAAACGLGSSRFCGVAVVAAAGCAGAWCTLAWCSDTNSVRSSIQRWTIRAIWTVVRFCSAAMHLTVFSSTVPIDSPARFSPSRNVCHWLRPDFGDVARGGCGIGLGFVGALNISFDGGGFIGAGTD